MKLEFEMDPDDYASLQQEFAERQRHRDQFGVMLPDGESDLPGAMIGLMCRELEDYRALFGFIKPPHIADHVRRGHLTSTDLMTRMFWTTLEKAICDENLRLLGELEPGKAYTSAFYAELFRRAVIRSAHGLVISTAGKKWRLSCVPRDCEVTP